MFSAGLDRDVSEVSMLRAPLPSALNQGWRDHGSQCCLRQACAPLVTGLGPALHFHTSAARALSRSTLTLWDLDRPRPRTGAGRYGTAINRSPKRSSTHMHTVLGFWMTARAEGSKRETEENTGQRKTDSARRRTDAGTKERLTARTNAWHGGKKSYPLSPGSSPPHILPIEKSHPVRVFKAPLPLPIRISGF